ncbi:hypothetical protein [Halalkalibaculum sp. DA384]|uniref:hypothetical protein n=1 Tax=Halalkalibaculum sp. DA384 TaxID=3373606 RepID=UPI003754A105
MEGFAKLFIFKAPLQNGDKKAPFLYPKRHMKVNTKNTEEIQLSLPFASGCSWDKNSCLIATVVLFFMYQICDWGSLEHI